ncbi:Tol-Pal system beta propeller repeat protein TolB [Methylomarinum vadi]|uniref:Tol-Pal system beta propeller repeat protein TolB n=1 Tax=Methylomarinum vadi TaxID=438855 RepID=UPI0004DFB861|nr:Tol-Pal system beta propeller repeat protein TolB [Methylomarinum vadi]
MVLLRKLILALLVALSINAAQAALTIEITKGVETAVPIAVVPFAEQTPGRLPVDLAAVIQADLSRSGYFKTLPERDMLSKPRDAASVRFRNWQALGQDYLLIGQVGQSGTRYHVQFQLFDVYKGEQIMGYRLTVSPYDLRRTAHHISDLVFEKLTGKAGVFDTRIAYVTSNSLANGKKQYKLQVADADGYAPKTIAASSEPLMSPAWSPDGKKIAYVSFERKRSAVYVQTLATGQRQRVAAFKGINGAPAFSPDGNRLALTLSKDGSPDIYILNLLDHSLYKLTKSYAIDTEPTWSPDGRYIVFTSDRGGKPQLYMMPSTGGRASRLTFSGDYNARGRFSHDGKSIVMVHANRGDYRIAVMDMATRTVNVLTAGRLDESPSFAPNGTMVLYAAKKGGHSVLSAVSVDGSMQQKLAFESGDVREPAWAP